MLRVYELKIPITESEQDVRAHLLALLPEKNLELVELHPVRISLDARKKRDIYRVYTLDFRVQIPGRTEEEAEAWILRKGSGLRMEKTPEIVYEEPMPGRIPLKSRPVIAGFGPCGMFAALLLAEKGYCPLVLERGKPVEQRVKDVERFWTEGVLNTESNVQFGEGGAGTFSDGKLTTRIRDMRVRKVLEELHKAGASEDILYLQKPHIGTDVLRDVVRNIRQRILALGGEIRFQSRLTAVEMNENGALRAVFVNDTERLETDHLILALGHSARDTFRMLRDIGMEMEQKPFSMGVRIEHLQSMVDRAQYGQSREACGLPPAEYQLHYRCKNGRGVYTFCMCPGGAVVAAASQVGGVAVNGMSNASRSGENANSAVLVDVRPEDFGSADVLAGVAMQEKYERLAFLCGGSSYCAPAQRVGAFMEIESSKAEKTRPKPTYRPGVKETSLDACLPDFVVSGLREAIPEFGKKLRGFDDPEALMTGVETRSSSPVRLIRDDGFQSNIKGIYPGGEGAGYAGGIVSAAVDGIRLAEQIIRTFGPIK